MTSSLNALNHNEHAFHLYDEITAGFMESQLIALRLRNQRNDGFMEGQLKEDTKYQDQFQKTARDKDLVYNECMFGTLL